MQVSRIFSLASKAIPLFGNNYLFQILEKGFAEKFKASHTDLFENLSVNSLKGDLSNATTFNQHLFSLVNTFKIDESYRLLVECTAITRLWLSLHYHVQYVQNNDKAADPNMQTRLSTNSYTFIYIIVIFYPKDLKHHALIQ
jgi:hypothetical protein